MAKERWFTYKNIMKEIDSLPEDVLTENTEAETPKSAAADLRERLAEKDKELTFLRNQVIDIREQSIREAEQNKMSREQLVAVQKEKDELDMKLKSFDLAADYTQKIEGKLEEAQEEIERLTATTEVQKEEIDRFTQRLEREREDARTTQSAVEQVLQEEIEVLKTQLAEQTNLVVEHEEQARLLKEYEALIAEYEQQERQAFGEVKSETEVAITDLERMTRHLKDQLTEYPTPIDLQNIWQEKELLEKQVGDQKKLARELSLREQEVKLLTDQVNDIKAELDAAPSLDSVLRLSSENEQLKEEIDALNTRLAAAPSEYELMNLHEGMKQELFKKEAAYEEQQQQTGMKYAAEKRALEDQINALYDKLNHLQAANDRLRKQNTALELQVQPREEPSDLEAERVTAAQKRLEEVEQANAALQEELQRSKQEIGEILLYSRQQATDIVSKAELKAEELVAEANEEVCSIGKKIETVVDEIDVLNKSTKQFYSDWQAVKSSITNPI